MNIADFKKKFNSKNTSLVQRIVLAFIFGWLALIIITVLSVNLSIKEKVTEGFYQSEEKHLLMLIERVENAFEQRKLILQQLAPLMLENDQSLIEEKQMSDVLKIAQLSNLFQEFVVLNANGVSIGQYPFNPDRVDIDYSDRSFVRTVMETKQGVISFPVLGRVTNLPSIFVLEPILDNENTLLGVLIGRVALEKDSLFHQISNEFVRFEGELLILDISHGIFIAATDINKIMQPVQPKSVVSNIVDSYNLGELYKDASKDWIYSIEKFNSFEWVIINLTPISTVTELVRYYVVDYLKIILPLIFILGVIVNIWVIRIFNPLRHALHQLENNLLNHSKYSSIHVSRADEVGRLLMAINELELMRDKQEKIKEELLSNVTHELRTPLTAIRAAINLLSVDNGSISKAEQKELIALSQRNSDKLLLLISDLLDLSSLSQGRLVLDMKKYNLYDVVFEAVNDIESIAINAEIKIYLESDDLKVFVSVDKFRLQQVLFNLLSNAIKFSPENSTIMVKLIVDTTKVSVLISDQGVGISEENHRMIFERFTQVDSSEVRVKGGTGLGLAISYELIKEMNGEVWLKSYPGKGSTFGIDLPVVSNS
ncbi:sensor histidine kinase [Nitrincola schmidtii]|uniref:ATP-binding response regulator n=1 Tax=Nitrincola schmidtii TaxID=1730894 RepID=UPI00124EDC2A|nr:sensor histidine kinase [Nitrincola schmidtii]